MAELHQSVQSVTVVYTDDVLQCGICSESHQSNGKMIILDNCNHTFDLSCLIQYASYNKIKCPICGIAINDIRLSIAVAFQKNSLTELVKCLTDN